MKLSKFSRRLSHSRSWILPSLIAAALVPLISTNIALSQDADKKGKQDDSTPVETAADLRTGILVQIPLPVTLEVSAQVKQVLTRHLEKAPLTMDPKKRPVLVLEFDTSNSRNGRGSEFEACLSLARFLTSSKMNRLETIAYIPGPKGILEGAEVDNKLESRLMGHAVLIALSCNHLIMHVDSSIGMAGIDEEFTDKYVVDAYEMSAAKRLRLPAEVAVAMVNPSASLYRVQTANDEYVFANAEQREKMDAEGKVTIGIETLTEAGSLPIFSSQQLSSYQLIRQRTTSRRDIARRFNLKPNSLEGDPTLGEKWVGLQVKLDRSIDQKTVSWVINALDQKWTEESNLIVVYLDTDDADIRESIRLARHLASYDSNKTRTIAYVPYQAQSAAAIVALACDHLVMAPDATIGGGSIDVTREQLSELMGSIKEIAAEKNRDWSLFAAMVDTELPIFRYQQKDSGQVRLLSPAEYESLDDKENWLPLDELSVEDGISGTVAEKYFVARYLVDDYQQLKTFYQLSEDPEILEPTMTDKWIENFAGFLASPMVSFWLLFGAMFFLSSEMSQPGLGVPGFIGSMLLVLFFWSQFLDGNADWLEIILFVAGVACILVEVFVIPGFGMFGIIGLLMMVVSIVLATQSFIIPRNSEEFNRIPVSLSMVVGASFGCIAALVVFRRFLPHMPIVKRIMLSPPGHEDDGLNKLENRESMVQWEHLLNQKGQAITRLVPAGKARIGDEVIDVITDGRLMEKGSVLIVTKVQGNRVVVAPVD